MNLKSDELKNIISSEIYTVYNNIVLAFLVLYKFREDNTIEAMKIFNIMKRKLSILSKQIKLEARISESYTKDTYEGGKTFAEMRDWLHENIPNHPFTNASKKSSLQAELLLLNALSAISFAEYAFSKSNYANTMIFMRTSIESVAQAVMMTNARTLKILGNEKISEITAAGGLARAKEYQPKKEEAIKLFEAGGYSSYDACANAIYEKLGVKSPRTVASWLSKHYKEKSRKE